MDALETSRLFLRPVTREDAGQVQQLFPHWEIVRHLANVVPWPYPPDGARSYFEHVAIPAMQRGDEWHWSIRRKSDPGQLIGVITLRRGEKDNRGFWIGLPYQRQGYATEAAEAVTNYWFDVLGFDVMRIPKAVDNIASRRISERSGMRVIATEERDYVGGRMPTEIWEITKEEWHARRSKRQVFLGGAAGSTTWRQDIAIPALTAAGISYFNPQLAPGAWTEDCEAAEMLAKDSADVLLFVLNGETRGVATVAEIAYYLGAGRTLALSITDATDYDQPERDDLNRGRIFVRTIAKQCGVPVFDNVADAVQQAIALVRAQQQQTLTLADLNTICSELRFGDHDFFAQAIDGGFLLTIAGVEPDHTTGERQRYTGRDWYIPATASRSDVVRTALKAALTWQEHEVRERFTYRGRRLFSPHFSVDHFKG